MRTAHINGVYGVSSTGRLCRDIAAAGRAAGIESRVYYSERSSDAPEAVRYISDTERNFHALASRVSGLQGYWSKAATKRLLAMMEDFDPDVVHLHVVHGNCLCLPLLFDWLHRRQPAVVITLHDCWWFTGRCAYPTPYGCDGYAARGCAHCPAQHDICPSWFFDRAAAMLADKQRWLRGLANLQVVAVSDWVRAQAERSFLPPERLTRIYNWVDTETFRLRPADALRARLGLRDEKVVLGVAATLVPNKGLDDLVALARQLPPGYRMILIGGLEKGTQLPPDITHVARTDDAAELATYYSLAQVFVNPSRFETFGLTTAEALACGTPAVVYDVTACPELIGPGTGAIVPLQEGVPGLLRAVLAADKTPPARERCRQWAEAHFSVQQGAQAYAELYRRMMDRKEGPA